VPLIVLLALALVAGTVVALILAAIKRARLVPEVEATLTLELVEMCCIHEHQLN
jgi:hypothetical protein